MNQLKIFLAVVSNKRGDLLRKEAQHLIWNNYFTNIVGANDAQTDKPSVAPVDMVLRGHIDPAQEPVWFVGDTDIDMECAWNAKCVPILLRQSPVQPNEFGSWPPAIQFRNNEALCKWLRKLYR